MPVFERETPDRTILSPGQLGGLIVCPPCATRPQSRPQRTWQDGRLRVHRQRLACLRQTLRSAVHPLQNRLRGAAEASRVGSIPIHPRQASGPRMLQRVCVKFTGSPWCATDRGPAAPADPPGSVAT